MEYTVTFLKLQPLTADAFEIHLSRPKTFLFEAGQYVSLTIPTLAHLPIHEQFHDFSICSPPSEQPRLIITVRDSTSAYKQELRKLKSGDTLLLEGPAGTFRLPKNKCVLLAGGIGITPFMSMLLERRSHPGVTLLAFNSSEERVLYRQEIKTVEYVDSYFLVGRPSEAILKPYADFSRFLVAGPVPFVEACRSTLTKLGVSRDSIVCEDFPGYASV